MNEYSFLGAGDEGRRVEDMTDLPEPQLHDSIAFLKRLRPDCPWVLTAIPPDRGPTRTATFGPDKEVEALRWLQRQTDDGLNIYWMANLPRSPLTSKAKKEDVEEMVALYVDIDPKKGESPAAARANAIARLEGYSPPPSIIIDSGGGAQGVWLLDEGLYIGGDVPTAEEAERYNQHLELELGGDSCHNVDRILRLPGTINRPNKKKRKAGRIPRRAELLQFHDNRVYSLAEFTPAPPRSAAPAAGQAKVQLEGVPPALASLDELPDAVSQRTRMLIVQGCDPDEPDKYASRSEVTFAVCRGMVDGGCSDEQIAAVLLDPAWAISEHTLAQEREVEYAARQIERAREKAGSPRPRIIFNDSELGRVLDEAEAALITSGAPIYQQSGRLVHPVTIGATGMGDDQVRRAAGSLVIHDLNEYRLLEHISDAAVFVRRSMNAKGKVTEAEIGPPLRLAKHYAARVGAWRLPELAGISTIPTMREDGSIASEDGYDPASRLIIDKQGVTFPPVPDAPTKEDVERALALLIDPISQFPFVLDDEDEKPRGDVPSAARSAALSMMLTAVARHAIGAAPIFGLSAPSMETGKSLLADIPAMMVTGRRAAMISQGESEEEDAKRLLSILMRGDPVNVIDNITREVSGDALATIITEEKWSQRWLGQNKMIDVSTKAVFIANGNNLVFREDMAVRALMVSLDAQMERPGERRFDRDLRRWVPDNRAALVAAALTVLRAYVVAGRPRGGLRASRFAEWSGLIRGALVWLGEPDPLDTQKRVSAGDSARATLVSLMAALLEAFGAGAFVSCGEIIARTEAEEKPGSPPGPLALALGAACPGRGANTRALGKYLKSKVGRRHEGMWIKAHEDPKSGNRYAVMVEAEDAAPRTPELATLEDEDRLIRGEREPASLYDHHVLRCARMPPRWRPGRPSRSTRRPSTVTP